MTYRPKTSRDERQRIIDALKWTEAMHGHIREAKGIPAPVIEELKPKRITKPRTTPSEHQEQVAVIQWWFRACHGYRLPVFALFAIPNGGARDAITGARLKAEGVRAGVLDLMLVRARGEYHGLFIEMKVDNKKPRPEQREMIALLTAEGYATAVCWSADEAILAIKQYLN